jgi:hypothetical protein
VRNKLIATLVICLLFGASTHAATPTGSAAPVQSAVFTPEQLDNLLAPIALYPDPLLAQLLPAATFVEQVDEAARWLRSGKKPEKIDGAKWDVSVQSVGHYPQVIYMMADDLDWTAAVGQAYVTQSTDTFSSIQRLRARAHNAGALVTTPEQTVVVEQQTIKIVPAQPQVIYVPQYNPQVVYVEKDDDDWEEAAVVGAIAFGTGLAIGAWLNNDCDWHGGSVYYHGWQGTGWISHSSTYVHRTNSVYVNRSYTNVNVNRTVVNRNVNYNNISNYNNVSRNVNYNNVQSNRVNSSRTNVNANNVNSSRTNVNANNVNATSANRKVNNSTLDRNVNSSDQRLDSYRGQQAKPAARQSTQQPASRQMPEARSRPQQTSSPGAFGGYKGGAETRADSARGRASRSESFSRPSAAPSQRSAGGARQRPSGGGGGRRRN